MSSILYNACAMANAGYLYTSSSAISSDTMLIALTISTKQDTGKRSAHLLSLHAPCSLSRLVYQSGQNLLSQHRAVRWADVLFNVLLDISGIKNASTLRSCDDFCHQFYVRDHPTSFHYSNDGRLSLVVSVSCNTLMRLFIFFFGFLGLDLVDLDTIFRIRKVRINREGIVIVDIFSLWRLTEHPVFGTCQ